MAVGFGEEAPPVQNHPSLQLAVGVARPLPSQYCPGRHNRQADELVEPVSGLKEPAWHGYSLA